MLHLLIARVPAGQSWRCTQLRASYMVYALPALAESLARACDQCRAAALWALLSTMKSVHCNAMCLTSLRASPWALMVLRLACRSSGLVAHHAELISLR